MEVKEIKEAFNKVIVYSQGIPEPKTDKLFDKWLEAKRDIIEAFGGKYIYEYPDKVLFELNEKEKNKRVELFIYDVIHKWNNNALADFVIEQKKGFFNNTTIYDYKYYEKSIKKGSKLVKAFKYFVNDKRALNDIQSEASRIIQENKIEGTLCFSVHPLDFLSLSENTYNWRSCHALDGEYRAGNLSYMMDSSTFICYLKSDKMEKLPRFPEDVLWNSKKWRVLLYLSNDWRMMFAGRQYPFETITGMNFILDVLRSTILSCDNGRKTAFNGIIDWTDWNNNLIEKVELSNNICINFDYPFVPVADTLIRLDQLVENGEGSKHFNDVLDSSCYRPIYSIKYAQYHWSSSGDPYTSSISSKFSIGGYTYCLHCGKKEVMDSGSETMRCEECELKYGSIENDFFCQCDSCGDRIYTEDSYIFEDEILCEHCYNHQTCQCERCDERNWIENIKYHEGIKSYICKLCFEDLEEENMED